VNRLVVLLIVGLVACGDVERRRPLGVADGDDGLAPTHLVVPDDDRPLALSTTPVTHTHLFDAPTLEPTTVVRPHVAESRDWAMTVSGDQLRVGLAVPTTVPGSVVELRRAPVGDLGGPPLGASVLKLRPPSGEALEAGEGADTLLEGTELATVHPGLGGDVMAFRLDPLLGSGTFELSIDGAPPDAVYGVRVRERDSPLVLRLETDRATYLHGDIVRVHASLRLDESPVTTKRISAVVVAPDGSTRPLELEATGPGRYSADYAMDALTPTPGALWTVQVSVGIDVDAGVPTRRTAHTAFGYAIPTARLAGVVDLDIDAKGFIVADLPVEVAAEGRYAISGTLWSAGGDKEIPKLMSQSAVHLPPGEHSMRMVFDTQALERAGLEPPFVVRDLRLLDQSRVALLQRHPDAFTISSELLER
jgi:hypothetical protein